MPDITYKPRNDCPDPLCLLDMSPPIPCFTDCPFKPTPTSALAKPEASVLPHSPGWGGQRAGAGAPMSNLNAIKTGLRSDILKDAIDRLADDPKLRAFLMLIARAAITGELPQTTRQLILRRLRK